MNIVINIGQRGAGGVVSARRRRSERAERAVVSAESNVHCIRGTRCSEQIRVSIAVKVHDLSCPKRGSD